MTKRKERKPKITGTRLERAEIAKARLNERAHQLDITIRSRRDAARYQTKKRRRASELRMFFLLGKIVARDCSPDSLYEWFLAAHDWVRPSDKILFEQEWYDVAAEWAAAAKLTAAANEEGDI